MAAAAPVSICPTHHDCQYLIGGIVIYGTRRTHLLDIATTLVLSERLRQLEHAMAASTALLYR